jgi:hypothetical protein
MATQELDSARRVAISRQVEAIGDTWMGERRRTSRDDVDLGSAPRGRRPRAGPTRRPRLAGR